MSKEDISDQSMPVTLRTVTASDDAFLLTVYGSTRADELAQVPWSDAQREAFIRMQFDAQQLHYRTHNPAASHDIILVGDHPIGRLYVARRDREIRILDITILPEHRGRGMGTSLLRDLMSEAARAGLPLTIYVESFNRSHSLFERLGFSKAEDDGVLHLMEWRSGD